MASENTQLNVKKCDTIMVYSYRWVILFIFTSYCMVNFFLIFQFTIISNITESFYNIGSVYSDASGLVFMLAYILFAFPIGQFIEKHDLRTVSTISTGLTACGNLLKFFALSSDRFYWILISQSICGVAQVFMMGLPPKVACVWFGPTEVSKACGVGVMGFQLGMALGSFIPTYLVPDSPIRKEVYQGLLNLFILDNVTSGLAFFAVILFFRSEPEHPPSLSQANVRQARENIEPDQNGMLGKYFMNKDFLLILYCFGTVWGLWNTISFTVNEVFLHEFPDIGNIIGILLMLCIIVGGVFGSLIVGYILDKTHEFKKLSLFFFTTNCISWLIFIIFMKLRWLAGACTSFLVAGFFGGSLAVTSFEYSTEVLYPLPEAYGTTILSVSIYFFSIIYTLLTEFFFSRFGFLAGQIMITFFFGTSAVGCIFISSNFKRRQANLSGVINENIDLSE